MSYFEQVKVEPGQHPIPITWNDTATEDAFQRLRVASPSTLFDGKTLTDAQPLKFDDQEVSGSGTSSNFIANNASVDIGVGDTAAGKRVRQTFQRFNYLPGKSQLFLCTFNMGAAATGITREVGLFDDRNGLFLRQSSSGPAFVRRSYTTNSAVDEVVAQENWNLDKLDGTGASGITLDLSKTQILIADFEWLGVGRVRMGFNINGITIYCHEFNHANVLETVYISTPNLPIRYSIENDGTGDASTLKCICSTVISEGGQDRIGQPFSVSNAAIRDNLDGSGATKYGLLGLRLKSVAADQAVVAPTILSVVADGANDAYVWELILNPTIAGTPTWVGVTNSAVEWFDGTSANTLTGGTVLLSGASYSRQSQIVLPAQDNIQLGAFIDGTPQTLVLAVRPLENSSGYASVSWRELS